MAVSSQPVILPTRRCWCAPRDSFYQRTQSEGNAAEPGQGYRQDPGAGTNLTVGCRLTRARLTRECSRCMRVRNCSGKCKLAKSLLGGSCCRSPSGSHPGRRNVIGRTDRQTWYLAPAYSSVAAPEPERAVGTLAFPCFREQPLVDLWGRAVAAKSQARY